MAPGSESSHHIQVIGTPKISQDLPATARQRRRGRHSGILPHAVQVTVELIEALLAVMDRLMNRLLPMVAIQIGLEAR